MFAAALLSGAYAAAPEASASDLPAGNIRIAVVGPMSGDLAEYGLLMRKAAELAVADINSAGGVLGRQLQLVVQDDRCDVEHAKSIADQVAARQVVFVAGHYCSGLSIPASEVYHRRHILMMSPASSNPKLTDGAARAGFSNVFRCYGRDDQQGVVAGEYIASHFSGKRIALVRDDSNYGDMIATIVRDTLASANIVPTLDMTLQSGRDSYQDMIDNLVKSQVDVVYFSGFHQEAAVILRQAHEYGLNAQFLGPDAFLTPELFTMAGPAAQGVRFTAHRSSHALPDAEKVMERLGIKRKPSAEYVVTTYAAIQAFAAAAEYAQATDVDALATALRAHSFDTVIGKIEFDHKGDLKSTFWSWYAFNDGVIRPLD